MTEMEIIDAKNGPRSLDFHRKKHIKFFERMLDGVSGSFGPQETNLMTVVYFCVGGLDLLGASDVLKKRRENLISFVYSLQKTSPSSGRAVGFFGNMSDVALNAAAATCLDGYQIGAGIASTYAGLCVLLILQDDLAGIDRPGMAQFIKSLQSPDGSFHGLSSLCNTSTISAIVPEFCDESETDMRFVFCACAISYMIGDWSGIAISRTLQFIWRSKTYEGGFAQFPGAECHGGSTYCAVAAAKLIHLAARQGIVTDTSAATDRNSAALFQSPKHGESEQIRGSLIRWCVLRQLNGFSGRANKPEDSCYTFWLGATLKMVNAYEFVDEESLEDFCISTQDAIVGGFAKWPSTRSDPLHSYLCMAGLSLASRHQQESSPDDMLGFESTADVLESQLDRSKDSDFLLKPVFAALNVSGATLTHLMSLMSRHSQ